MALQLTSHQESTRKNSTANSDVEDEACLAYVFVRTYKKHRRVESLGTSVLPNISAKEAFLFYYFFLITPKSSIYTIVSIATFDEVHLEKIKEDE